MNKVEIITQNHAVMVDNSDTVWARCELTDKDADCCMLLIYNTHYNVNRDDALDIINGDYPSLDLVHEHELENMCEEMLDDIYGDIEICSYMYSAGHALKNLDPVAFRQEVLNYIDALVTDSILIELGSELYRKV